MAIKAVFVDVDNTLLDFDAYVYHTMEVGFDHFGLRKFEPWMADTFHVENNKLWRQIEEGTLVFAELEKIRWNRIFEAIGIDFDGPTFEKYFRAALWDSAIEVEGASDLLKSLKETGYLVCAASNGPYDQQLHRLEIAGMLPYFDYVFISGDLGASKPATEFFEKAFERIGADRPEGIRPEEIKPKDCLMIGDSMTSDVAGGKNFGMQTCFYNPRGKSGEADFVFATLGEIREYFCRIGN